MCSVCSQTCGLSYTGAFCLSMGVFICASHDTITKATVAHKRTQLKTHRLSLCACEARASSTHISESLEVQNCECWINVLSLVNVLQD